MSNAVVVGTQWGDEGKAKVIDYLSERSDIIIRYQGGANAGHTVIVDGRKFVFHMVPSGIMYPDKVCIVGNGVVFDCEQFFNEIRDLGTHGVSVTGRLFVSDQAHLVLPYHKVFDRASESQMADGKIGTTGRGIGPAYADKALRRGIRVGALLRFDECVARLKENIAEKKFIIEQYYHQKFELDAGQIIECCRSQAQQLAPYITDTHQYLFSMVQKKMRLLFEGAQGTFLDIDHGTYPYVTSSNTVSGAACTGGGVGPSAIDHVIGIVKTYTTRVGNGPFPTELSDATGEHIRAKGAEFGATTGRPRRCGWFDTVMVRKSVHLNGLTRLALTKLDVLGELSDISMCTHYEIQGKKTDSFPADPYLLEKAKPVYETLPGWKCDLSGCKKLSDFPANARRYIDRLQQLCFSIPLLLVSVGPDRVQTIEVETI